MTAASRARSSLLLAALATSLAACSSSGDAGTPSGATPGGDGGEATACKTQVAGQPPPAGYQCVKTVDAKLVDPAGAPLAGLGVMACGRNICNTATSGADGAVHFDVFQYMDRPAFKIPGSTPYVQFAWRLPADKDVHDLGTVTLVPLPTDGKPIDDNGGAATTSDQAITTGDVTLTIAKGSTITIDSLSLDTPDRQAFRGFLPPSSWTPPSADASLGLEAYVSLTPLDTLISPAAALTFPNPKGWAAGATVELFLHGVDLTSEAVAPYGEWLAVGTGTVSSDGSKVTTDGGAGNGIAELSLVGLRAKK